MENHHEFQMPYYNINDKMDFLDWNITNQERLVVEGSNATQITPDPQICPQAMYDSMTLTQRHILKSVLEIFAPGSPLHVTLHSPTALSISDGSDDLIMFSDSPQAPVYDNCHFPYIWKEHQVAHPTSPASPEPLAP